MNIGLAPSQAATKLPDVGSIVAQTAAIKVHRTANYLLSATSLDTPRDEATALPLVVNVTAFLGQKIHCLQSTIQVGSLLHWPLITGQSSPLIGAQGVQQSEKTRIGGRR